MVISLVRDANRIAMLGGTLNTDGKTVVAIKVNPVNHALKTIDAATGSSFSILTNQRDANRVTTIWGTSSSDGVTPIYIATDSSGNLLIDSS